MYSLHHAIAHPMHLPKSYHLLGTVQLVNCWSMQCVRLHQLYPGINTGGGGDLGPPPPPPEGHIPPPPPAQRSWKLLLLAVQRVEK